MPSIKNGSPPPPRWVSCVMVKSLLSFQIASLHEQSFILLGSGYIQAPKDSKSSLSQQCSSPSIKLSAVCIFKQREKLGVGFCTISRDSIPCKKKKKVHFDFVFCTIITFCVREVLCLQPPSLNITLDDI